MRSTYRSVDLDGEALTRREGGLRRRSPDERVLGSCESGKNRDDRERSHGAKWIRRAVVVEGMYDAVSYILVEDRTQSAQEAQIAMQDELYLTPTKG